METEQFPETIGQLHDSITSAERMLVESSNARIRSYAYCAIGSIYLHCCVGWHKSDKRGLCEYLGHLAETAIRNALAEAPQNVEARNEYAAILLMYRKDPYQALKYLKPTNDEYVKPYWGDWSDEASRFDLRAIASLMLNDELGFIKASKQYAQLCREMSPKIPRIPVAAVSYILEAKVKLSKGAIREIEAIAEKNGGAREVTQKIITALRAVEG